jgi:hypothetical protein
VITNVSVLLIGHSWVLMDTEWKQDEINCVIRRLMVCTVQHRVIGLRRLRWLEYVACTKRTEINATLWSRKQKEASSKTRS